MAEKFETWKSRIEWSKKRVEALKEEWKRAVMLFESAKNGQDTIKVPFLFSVFSTQLPALFSSLPKIKATAKLPSDLDSADLIERIIEDIADRTHLYDEVFETVYSSLLLGIGFVKVGYSSKVEEVEKTEEEVVRDFFAKHPHGTEEEFKKFIKTRKNLTEEVITDEGVFVDYVKANDILLDPEAEKLESCRFIAHRVLLTKDEFRERFLNKEIDEASVKRIPISSEEEKALGDYVNDADAERYELFEIWDKPNRRYMVIAEGYEGFLEDKPWPYDLTDYPFEALVLSPKLGSIYGINEILMHETASKVIDDMTSRQEDNAQRVKSILAYEKGAIDDDQLEKLTSPGENKAIEVNDLARILLIQTPPIPQETYAVKDDMKRQIEETTHISAQVRQTSTLGAQTATEIQAITQAGNVLTYFKIRRIEQFIENVVRKLVALVKQYYDQPKLVRIDDRFGLHPFFVRWIGKDIGEYTFSVRAGSVAYQDSNIRLQQAMQFLGQVMQLRNFLPNPQPLVEELLLRIGNAQGINPETVKQTFKNALSNQQMTEGEFQTLEIPNNPMPSPVAAPEETAPKIQTPRFLG